MTLEEVFFVSQTIAAAAVVASIVYLAREVRQSERVQRATMQQGRADRVSKNSMNAAAHPGLAVVWQKGLSAQPELSREEFAQWMLLCRAGFLSMEDSFLQHKADMLDEEAFTSFVAGVRSFVTAPGMRTAWRMTSVQYGRSFREFVDGELAKSPQSALADSYVTWQEQLKLEVERTNAQSGGGRPRAGGGELRSG